MHLRLNHQHFQAYGTAASTFLVFVFSLMAAYVYIRHPESEYWDIYCPFSLATGYLGMMAHFWIPWRFSEFSFLGND